MSKAKPEIKKTGSKRKPQDKSEKFLIIGAGPAGLATARNLQRYHIPFEGVDGYKDVGGLWDIENPHSTVYETAHLISSKRMTEFAEFPMKKSVAEYPSHTELATYFRDFAQEFDLYKYYKFNTKVKNVTAVDQNWLVEFHNGDSAIYKGVLIATGTLHHPNIPEYPGKFSGKIMHSSEYKSPKIFEGKRVLIVGAGNSGCDIAVDAIHYAKKVKMSVRRGYHFVPKYVFGKPADTLGGLFKLPAWAKQKVDSLILGMFTLDPEKYGFPKADHKLYESHPIVNSLILHHLGHGDIAIKQDVLKFNGKTVYFKDGTSEEFDLILYATGYKLYYPFISPTYLNWKGAAPDLYLNTFHPVYNNLFVMGMVEASGIGWEGRYEQAEMVAGFIKGLEENTKEARKLVEEKSHGNIDLSGGFHYIKLDRMAYYVERDTYRNTVRQKISRLSKELNERSESKESKGQIETKRKVAS
ncbi:flavin-containing monooxygenase [Leptospira stimsonii]|uniref:Monooxygenase n=1 Tax=Leptospira stimsonii TaxID=2202203 RepID=A0A4R9L2B6_9LEPT|nr:NAD(P)-binding domain-containing protein [Leptospira stimsonii]RHX83084.1 monooxygenase [Leptospira stimsonii]TGK19063.1 NAD(P)/FAD-dependent oxidoreductase [Leptospira stimsonii]TGM11045.1 NAD(P)/FAD-dependent oxidoreductase [Leptospira stimsonii]